MAEPPAHLPTDFTAAGEARPPTAARPRDAATLLLWRRSSRGIQVLMGLRSAGHRFMPSRLVFPGGRVDPADRSAPVASPLSAATRRALERRASPRLAHAIAVAAVRELHEETGLVLGEPAGDGVLPTLAPLGYLCRALTPAMSPIRFNARFLHAPAEAATGALGGSGELEQLGWHGLDDEPRQELAPITARVLEEFRALMVMDESAREARLLVWFQGRDRRRPER